MRVLIIRKNHFSLCHTWIEFISRSFRKFKNYNKVQKLEQIFNYFPIDRVRSRALLCWFSALLRWSTIFQLHLLLSSVVEQTQSVFSQASSMKISWGDLNFFKCPHHARPPATFASGGRRLAEIYFPPTKYEEAADDTDDIWCEGGKVVAEIAAGESYSADLSTGSWRCCRLRGMRNLCENAARFNLI